MTDDLNPDDIAAMRKEGDLRSYLRGLISGGRNQLANSQRPEAPRARPAPFHVRRPGAWPCGTAASGPTPAPCDDCRRSEATP